MIEQVIYGTVKIHDPDESTQKTVLAAIGKIRSRFPDHNLANLGGLDEEEGRTVLWYPRGLTRLLDGLGPMIDKTVLGPQVEVYVDESKLDERAKYQHGLINESMANGREGIIVAPTGAGKTVIAALMIDRIKRRTLILTHTTEIANQFRATLEKLMGIKAGFIGGGERSVAPITVGLIQSIRSRDPILRNIGCLIVDEAHHISAPSYLSMLRFCPATYRYGLTATIEKTGDEQKIIYAAIGPVLGKIPVDELQEKGFLNKGFYRSVLSNCVGTYADFVSKRCHYYRRGEKTGEKTCPAPCTYPVDDDVSKCVYQQGYFSWVYSKLATDEVRNKRLIEEIIKVSKDHPWTVVLTKLKSHANYISKTLHEAGQKVRLAMGPPMSKVLRENMIKQFREEGGILVATALILGEGFDAPKTSCLVRAMPAGGRVAVRQQTGRVMRPQEKPSLIVDFVDPNIPWLGRMWRARQSIYKTIGFSPEVSHG